MAVAANSAARRPPMTMRTGTSPSAKPSLRKAATKSSLRRTSIVHGVDGPLVV
jgi:hypothetical protein